MLSDFIFEPPKKRKFIPKIKYSILKKIFLIKWFLLININYYLNILFSRNRKIVNNIFILSLSKNRPRKLERLLNSINILSKKKDRIKILILLDEDEKMKNDYVNIAEEFKKKKLDVNLYYKNFNQISEGYNFLARTVKQEGLFCLFSDDIIVTLNEWDEYIDFLSSKLSSEKAFSIWTRSNNHTERYYTHSEHPIVNSLWFKAVGYIDPPKLKNIPDLWICELGRLSGNFIVSKKMIYNHLRADENPEEIDETYLNLKKKRQSENYNWHPKWIETTNERIKDAEKIKNFKKN